MFKNFLFNVIMIIIIFIQGKPLQCRNTVINGGHVKIRWIKLRLILRREENQRTRRKTLEARKRPTTTTLFTRVPSFLRINTRLYPGGHPSSYNPVQPGLTWNSVVKGNVLTTSAIRVPPLFYYMYLLHMYLLQSFQNNTYTVLHY